MLRDNDPATLSINMIPQLEKYGYNAKLTCYGQGRNGEPTDGWASATTTVSGTGTYTVTFSTNEPRLYGQVYLIDIEKFAAAYPNAFVKIETIKADGNDVPFDANKFYYDDIENNGNFRPTSGDADTTKAGMAWLTPRSSLAEARLRLRRPLRSTLHSR